MKCEIAKNAKKGENLLVFFTEEGWKKEKGKLKKELDSDFSGKAKEVAVLYGVGGFRRIILSGLGKKKKLDLESFRKAANSFAVKAKKMKLKKVSVDASKGHSLSGEGIENAILEGIMLGQYSFLKYKQKEAKEEVKIGSVKFLSSPGGQKLKKRLENTIKIMQNTMIARDLVNSSSDEVTSLEFEKISKSISKKCGIKASVMNENEIKKKGLGLIAAVNRGSNLPARLIFLEHSGGKKGDPLIAVVGKGISFDSGGYNLKPSGHIEQMRMDMAGAATVLGVMKSLAELKVKKNVIGVMAITENMIDANAYKPGDVFKAYDGTTVEIKNTDAEGRLILADSVAYTVKNKKPDFIFDTATLTGSCITCLGEMAAGVISNDEKKAAELQKFSHMPEIFERVWVLPSYDEAGESLKSEIADLKNLGWKGKAGTITAGLFIGKFVKNTPWIHIDIAGTGMNDGKRRDYIPEGGTGFGVKLLTEFIKESSFKKMKRKNR